MAEKLGPLNASSSPAPAAGRPGTSSEGFIYLHGENIASKSSSKNLISDLSQKLNQAPSLEVHLPLRYQDLHLDREIGSCQSGTLFTNLQNAD